MPPPGSVAFFLCTDTSPDLCARHGREKFDAFGVQAPCSRTFGGSSSPPPALTHIPLSPMRFDMGVCAGLREHWRGRWAAQGIGVGGGVFPKQVWPGRCQETSGWSQSIAKPRSRQQRSIGHEQMRRNKSNTYDYACKFTHHARFMVSTRYSMCQHLALDV